MCLIRCWRLRYAEGRDDSVGSRDLDLGDECIDEGLALGEPASEVFGVESAVLECGQIPVDGRARPGQFVLKRPARARHVRYSSYVRSILERAARGEALPEIADITERLERIERAVTRGQDADDQKPA